MKTLDRVRQLTEFFEDCQYRPLYKQLPLTYGDFRYVKVRHRSISTSSVDSVVDSATEVDNVRRRSVLVNTVPSARLADGYGVYYIIPIGQYQYIFNKNVSSFDDCDQLLSELATISTTLAVDVVTNTYNINDNLSVAFDTGADVRLFALKSFLAIQATIDYNEVCTTLLQQTHDRSQTKTVN